MKTFAILALLVIAACGGRIEHTPIDTGRIYEMHDQEPLDLTPPSATQDIALSCEEGFTLERAFCDVKGDAEIAFQMSLGNGLACAFRVTGAQALGSVTIWCERNDVTQGVSK